MIFLCDVQIDKWMCNGSGHELTMGHRIKAEVSNSTLDGRPEATAQSLSNARTAQNAFTLW
jgi:hypothetical protein